MGGRNCGFLLLLLFRRAGPKSRKRPAVAKYTNANKPPTAAAGNNGDGLGVVLKTIFRRHR